MKMIVLGLDGFHRDLLKFTPYIEDRFERDSSGTLNSTTPPVTAPAWASFQTGVNQGKHGVFDFVEYTDTQEMYFVDGQKLRAKPVYEWLDEAGNDCYIQNLPFSMPPRVSGDIMPSWLDSEETAPAPADLTDQYDVQKPVYPALDGTDLENIAEMSDSFSTNSDIFKSVLESEAHDFYFYLVSVTDWLQHTAYDDLINDPNTSVAKAARELLASVDEFIEDVFASTSDGTDIVLLSDHGFRLYDGSFYVNDWLSTEGYLAESMDGTRFTTKDETDSTVVTGGEFGQWIRERWFWKFLRPIKNKIDSKSNISFSAEKGIDMENTLAYCRSKDEKAIRITDGQAPNLDTLVDKLNDVGFISAELASELYSGPYTDRGGDIVLTDETHLVKRGPIGEIVVDDRIAHHATEGIFIGSGPSFSDDPTDAKLTDITPTILHQFDLAVPDSLDGEVLQDALNERKDIEYTTPDSYQPRFHSQSASGEAVQQRLENLGYLN